MQEKALKVLEEITNKGYKAYIVGGFVRDYLLGIESNDIDITTNATPKELQEIFEDSIIDLSDYGSVTVMIKNIRYEITTFRKEIKYIEQTLELYSKSSEIKAFIKEKNNKNAIQIKDNINVSLESDSNSLIIEEREIKLNDGKKTNLQFVSTADMQKDAKDLSLKFLPYSLLISILFSAIISLIYAKSIKNNIQEIKIVTDKMMKLDKKTRLKVSSNDEVGELKQQINDLYSTLLRTIDDLEFKNKEILKLEKLKYDFFKGASHELKTPLASLKIILENMKYNIGKYKERDIYINECIEIVDSLTKNISQILSVHSI